MRTLVLVVGAAPTMHKVQRLLTMRAQQHPLLGSVHQLRPYISGNPGLRRSGSPPPLRQHRGRGAHRPARDGALRVLGERALRVVQDQVLVSVGGAGAVARALCELGQECGIHGVLCGHIPAHRASVRLRCGSQMQGSDRAGQGSKAHALPGGAATTTAVQLGGGGECC